jgi:hypothetical protein
MKNIVLGDSTGIRTRRSPNVIGKCYNFCDQFSRLNVHLDVRIYHITNEPFDTKIEALFQNLVAILIENGCWRSLVGVETSSGLYGPEFEFRQGQNIFISQDRPDGLWGPSFSCFMVTAVLSRR